jgi:hypothetical protein
MAQFIHVDVRWMQGGDYAKMRATVSVPAVRFIE